MKNLDEKINEIGKIMGAMSSQLVGFNEDIEAGSFSFCVCKNNEALCVNLKKTYLDSHTPSEIAGALSAVSITNDEFVKNIHYCLRGHKEERNKTGIVYRRFLDLDVLYEVRQGSFNFFITHDIMKHRGFTNEDLERAAAKNLERPGFCTGRTLVETLVGLGMEAPADESDDNVYVLSAGATEGACVLLNNKFIAEFVNKKNLDYIQIIPSSIHEILAVIPPKGVNLDESNKELKSMCTDVNDTIVSEGEILSYNIYIADRNGNVFLATN